jgi:gliding motility-associated-like protein
VTGKNQFLVSENAQKITGTKHKNGRDYWVITKGFGKDNGSNFDAWLVTPEGIAKNQVTNIGWPHQGSFNNNSGYMKISLDGSLLALAIPEDGIVQVFDFDNSTGILSEAVPAIPTPGMFKYPYGIEFSPDNSKLYFTTTPLGNDTTRLYQADLTQENPFEDPYIVVEWEIDEKGGADSIMGALQLAPDGKIYVAKFRRGLYGSQWLDIIYNPDRPGAACNFNHLNGEPATGLFLEGGKSLAGLPNFVSSFLNLPHFGGLSGCVGDTLLLQINNTSNIEDVVWEYDGDAIELVNQSKTSVEAVIKSVGSHEVLLTEIYDGKEFIYSENIHVRSSPFVDLGNGSDTIFILPGSSLRLDAGEHNTYIWEPGGSTNRFLDVDEVGYYAVTVSDSNCCKSADGVMVSHTNLYYPTAFQPDSYITINTEFRLISSLNSFEGYEYNLQVFNRWGQLMFETNNPSDGWNGTWNGDPMPVGTYVWTSVIREAGTGTESSYEMVQKGTVTLIR